MLQWVEVLCLVDEEVTEPPAHQRSEGRVGFDGTQVEIEKIVEVDDTAPSLQTLVGRGELREPTGRNRAASSSGADLTLVVGRIDAPRPGPVDVGHRRVRIQFDPQFLEALANETLAVGSERRHRLVASDRPVAQQAQGDAVEGAGFDGFVDVEPAQPAAQFACCVAGERERDDVSRVGMTLLDSVGDPAGQDHRLARTGSGHDRQRLSIGLDGAALVGVEPRKQPIHRHADTIRRLDTLLGARPSSRAAPGKSLQSCSCRSRRST